MHLQVQRKPLQDDVLTQANKLSIGGLGDLESTIDIVTSAMNSFEKSNLSATKITDVLFNTVKNGKTDLTQLSATFAKVLPNSAALGVSFEDTAAAVAALTASGIKTAESVTGLKAIFAGITRGQAQAAAHSTELGEAFSFAALKSKGLGQFIQDVDDIIGDDAAGLLKLLGSTEALTSFQALAANNANRLTSAIESNKNAAGAANKAYEEINNTVGQQQKIFSGLLEQIKITFGSGFSADFGKDLKDINNAIKILIPTFAGLGESLSSSIKPFAKGIIFSIRILKDLEGILLNIGALVVSGFSSIVESLTGAILVPFDLLGKSINILVLKPIAALITLVKKLGSLLPKSFQPKGFKKDSQALVDSLNGIGAGLSSVREKGVEFATSGIDEAAQSLANSAVTSETELSMLDQTLKKALNSLDGFNESSKKPKDIKLDVDAKIVDAEFEQKNAKKFTTQVTEFFSKGMNDAMTSLGFSNSAINDLERGFGGVGDSLLSGLGSASKKGGREAGVEFGIQAGQEIGAGFMDAWLGEGAGEFFKIFSNLSLLSDEEIEGFISGIAEGGVIMVEALAEKADVIVEALVNAFIETNGGLTMAAAIIKGMVKLAVKFGEFIANGIIEGLSAFFGTFLVNLAEGFMEFINGLVGTLQNAFRPLLEIGSTIYDAFIEGAQAVFDSISDALSIDIGGGGSGGLLGGSIIPGLLNKGGIVGMATGGTVPGAGNSDSALTMLTPGEIVIPKPATNDFANVVSDLAKQAVGSISGGGQGTQTVINQIVLNGEVLAEQILELNQNNARLA